MSESLKIIIDAEDLASAKTAAAAKNVENNIKAIKSSGEQAKKSTEFFGTIANALGGTELGAYASQLAGITEKTSQFAEVQKLGGAGAMAFKAGLVGVVGVLSFQVGSALGNVIFQTEKWQGELTKANEKSDKLLASMLELKDFSFGRDMEEISLIRDPDEQAAATKALLDNIENQIKDNRSSINSILEREAKQTSADDDDFTSMFGLNSERQAEVAKQVAEGEKLIESLAAQATQIRRNNDETAQRIKQKKEENALFAKEQSATESLTAEINLLKGKGTFISENVRLLTQERDLLKETKANEAKSSAFLEGLRNEVALLKAKGDELFKIEAGQKTFGQADNAEAAALLKERDMLKQKQEAEKAVLAQKENEAQRIADLKQRELDKLAEEQVLLTKGKEAAHAFSLEKQGLSKVDAENIARQQAQNDQLKAQQTAKVPAIGATQINQAFEARLLTRGSGGDPAKMTEQNTANAVKELQELRKQMLADSKKGTKLKVVKT
jgi:hypothetical protein